MSRNHLVRGLAALLLTGAVHQAGGAVFGLDRRKPFDATTAFDLGLPLSAVGTITCLDRHEGTGFVVDVSGYVVDEVDFHVVATAARSLTNPESGKSRGRCAFRPASDPGVHLEIGDLGERLVGTDAPENADGGDWAFAKLDKGKYELGSLRIAFEDVYDFDTPGEVEVRAIGLDDEEGVIAVSSSCRLDDKRAYPTLRRRDDGLDQMILHDCDFLGPAKGGPLVVFGQVLQPDVDPARPVAERRRVEADTDDVEKVFGRHGVCHVPGRNPAPVRTALPEFLGPHQVGVSPGRGL